MDTIPKRDMVLWNAMVAGFVQNGRMEDARQFFFFDKLSQRNVVSWTVMIAEYAQNGHFEDALVFFD
jgi:pentatricopeptide repeat protein